jgi:Ran GTPase-activating protein (RanGAP) involved in mRNA processing and transport
MLKKLDLAGNQIGDEGTKDLADALENNKVNCNFFNLLINIISIFPFCTETHYARFEQK